MAGLLLTMLPACLSLQSEEEKQAAAELAAKDRVMARHDELMARMDELYSLRQQLAKVSDSVAAGRRRRALLRADAAMMDWMHQYRQPTDSVSHARTLAYYARQQQRIDSVGVLMNQAVDSARLLLPAAPASSAR
ncbi:hypothetical protein [Hymenobacter sp. B81]|uniref:hypothetical protein n=1 Tax=Hymenobacter sp. B81 TaxID=3344878 RepID=UPI0037DD0A07